MSEESAKLFLNALVSVINQHLLEEDEVEVPEIGIFRNVKTFRIPGTEDMDKEYKECWHHIRGAFIGIGIGAAMHGYVPEGFFTTYLGGEHWYAVPLAVVLAVPMYSNAAGIVPVIEVFVAKGVGLGTALAFMMSVVGLSLPEATLLKKGMTMRLIGIFFGTVALMIILLGWLFNVFL